MLRDIFTGEIKLGEDGQGLSWNEIAREGTPINSVSGKKIDITAKMFDNVIDNFQNNVRQTYFDNAKTPAVPWDYAHETAGKAAGWIGALEIRPHKMPNGKVVKSLWAKNLSWSLSAQEAIKAGEWKFASVDINDYQDPDTGKTYKDVLYGVALTNRPAIKDMEPIQLSEADALSQAAKADDKSNADKKTKGDKQMIKKLKEAMGANGVQLAEGIADESIVDKTIDRLKYLSESKASAETKLAETSTKLSETETKLTEATKQLSEIKAVRLAEAKAELMEPLAKKFTPAELKDEKHYINVMLAEGKFEAVKDILSKAGVQLKERKKADEEAAEAKGEPDGDEGLDTSKEWDDNKSTAKHEAIIKHMEEAKADTEDDKEYAKHEKIVAAAHNKKFAASKGGK